MADNGDLTSIRNIGPAVAAALQSAGISSAAQLRRLGADKAYAKMLAQGTKPHFIGYYVLHMALQGRPWNDCQGQEKQDLRRQFDALVAHHFDRSKADLDDALAEIGVLPKKK